MRWLSAHSVGTRRSPRDSVGVTKERWLSHTFSWLLPDARQRNDYPAAPEGTLIYAVGDIHGRIDLLEELCARIDHDMRAERANKVLEVYIGDYVDRGPASAKVVDRLIQRGKERKTAFLRGNHEKILESFLNGKAALDHWRPIGGFETLISYGINPDLLRYPTDDDAIRAALVARMPDTHRSFLSDLQIHFSAGAYFFVHAGVRPGVALNKQGESDCLCIREEFLESEDDFGCVVVHGHSPVSVPELLPNRINLDTAAYATGRLSCLKISQQGASLLETDL
jgi:serine/threonine protein phosphatase 1